MKEKRAFFLLKFGSKQNLESLQKGNLYMKNLKFFIELEGEKQKKGMGDASEGSLVMNDVKLTLKDPQSDEVILEFEAKRTSLRNDAILNIPVFCAMHIGEEDLEQVGEEVDGSIATRILFTEQQKEEMVNEFGDYVLVIPVTLFMQRIQDNFNKEGYEYALGPIEYLDHSINQQFRFDEFNTGDPKLLFHKDRAFEYQKEFRLAILNQAIEDYFMPNIGDMTEFTELVKSSDLLEGNYGDIKITIRK
ncbi:MULTISPECIES: hypothetical protein [unclassified Paenibacillus]|uniref:hypothetical protein n=1 Tax=unclassified Paenibacillus TaxID=185978 RepID=UPI000CFC1AE8|nr:MULTISPECIES: hypothetical protein [unclassified Paenibacillus]PRA04838.1 hypothetical protein CQ043_12330 [Paenibacillus sp. MYb63]PRA47817.1 hypothetical protein CQ061_14500 [Paenibacillus sp. MYb67]